MRSLLIVGLLAGTAAAGPVLRGGVVGGYDTSAPGNREDGLALGAGYRYGPLTVELDYQYLEYNGADGVGGGASQLGVLLQGRMWSATCRPGVTCPHLDLDLGAGRRSVRWEPGREAQVPVYAPPTEVDGRVLEIGPSMTMGWHYSLHYVVFQPDPGPTFACRGACTMQSNASDRGVLLEISYTIGG